MPTSTPWGPAQSTTKYGRGINLYSCAGHGGFKVSAKLNERVHPALRRADGWYEEDCDWARVAVSFPEVFAASQINGAHSTLKNYFPDAYEEWYRHNCCDESYSIPPAESRVKRERAFRAENANRYIVLSASNSKDQPGLVECFAVLGGRTPQGQYASEDRVTFLVSATEYEKRGEFGFVIDESKHLRK